MGKGEKVNYDKWMKLTKDQLIDELQSALRAKRRWKILAVILGVAALMLLDGFLDGFQSTLSDYAPPVWNVVWTLLQIGGLIALAAWAFVWLDRRYRRRHSPSEANSSDSPDDQKSNSASDEGAKPKKARRTGRKWPVDPGSSLGAKPARDPGGQS